MALLGGARGTPDLLFAQVANVLWKGWRRGDFAVVPDGRDRQMPLFQRISPCVTLIQNAVALSVALDHPAYDCFYLAIAIVEDELLVTADRRFLSVCAGTRQAGRIMALGS